MKKKKCLICNLHDYYKAYKREEDLHAQGKSKLTAADIQKKKDFIISELLRNKEDILNRVIEIVEVARNCGDPHLYQLIENCYYSKPEDLHSNMMVIIRTLHPKLSELVSLDDAFMHDILKKSTPFLV